MKSILPMQLSFTVPKNHSIRAEEGGGKRLETPVQEVLLGSKILRPGGDLDQSERCQQQPQKDSHGLLLA